MIYLKSSVGVEIRGEDLLISCLRSNFSGGVFTAFRRIEAYRSRERQEVRREIDAFFRGERLKRDRIVLGLPLENVIVRFLDLPREVEDNLRQVVQYQVQSFEPTEENNFYHDYVLRRPAKTDKRLQVLLVMIRKPILDGHLEVLKELGIQPSIIMAGSIALAAMFAATSGEAAQKTFVVADCSSGRLELTILRRGFVIYTQAATKRDSDAWTDLLPRELESAVGKVRLDPEETIESILLAGERSEEVKRELDPDMEGCELLGRRLRFEAPVKTQALLQKAAQSLSLAYCGITRRAPLPMNLLPSSLRFRQTRWAYVPAAVLGLVIVALAAGLGLHRMYQERVLVGQIDAELQALKPRVDVVLAIRAEAEALEKRITFIEGILRKRDMNLEILRELTQVLPTDTFLNVYSNKDCTIQMSGSSSSAPDLIPKLEKSVLLMNVVQRGTIFKDAQTGKDRFTFEARCEGQK